MATCPKCNEFYQPTPDEERLIANKQMEPMCIQCAIQGYREREKDLPASPPAPLRETMGKTDGTKLARVEKFDSDGRSLVFIALPPLPYKPISHTLRRRRAGDLGVLVFRGNTKTSRLATEPRITLHTNITTFRKSGQPLWFNKIPGFWCPATGAARIKVQGDDIIDADVSMGATALRLKNGGLLRLSYR